ncbi:N-acetyl-alpha-D-glucosaminyl L-malate synthase BshA [Puniceicoccaceae bacterium K14]|nr:N-acetyl-alpha-D-glucosaminyl L-malate synthase BshA [Puniceicoccaceae bacterium K14]
MGKPLKIALLCHPSVGGSGILATELGHRMANLGHEVFVISERAPFRLNESHPNVCFCESKPVEFPLFSSPDHTLPMATKIAEVCSENDIDIIHAHYAIPHTAAAWIAKELIGPGGPPIVTTLHGTDIVYLGEMPEYRPLLQHVLEASDRVTCVSRNLKERALSLFDLENPIKVVPNFYEPKQITATRSNIRSELGVGDEALAIHASNLRSIKRIDLMLESFQAAAKTGAKLLILAGSDSSRIEGDVAKWNLEGSVIILENVYDVDNYFAAADFTLYSSEYESFCLGILEGMRHGLPSVSFAVGGIPEVVLDGETGFLVPFGSVDEMSSAILCLANNPTLRGNMGASARQRAMTQFSAQTIVNSYLNVYEEILSPIVGC